jgi:crotonobetainyl-CoA:carnitine CoA-transferase CaiB-like acyl-CoA transferase
MTEHGDLSDMTERIWRLTGGSAGALGSLTFTGPRQVLPSAFDVTGLAAASVAAAALAAAGFHAARAQLPLRPVSVDTRAASAAFACEALFTPSGWELPAPWDPIAGNYQAKDGWIRLHTNYSRHREAVAAALSPDDPGGASDRESVAARVRKARASELEEGIVEWAGGAAAVMRGREEWLASPQGAATARAPVLDVVAGPLAGSADDAVPEPHYRLPSPDTSAVADRNRGKAPPRQVGSAPAAPYAGIRVLDLTRVIAGPVGTRFLAAYGADVLRVDPPGFEEVPALLPETTAGKRTAGLDLRCPAGREAFEDLLATADVLVTGLRADALARLGYDEATVAAINPGLIRASLNAYGWAGPWRNRRGFDSLVQMSCGITAAGAAAAGQDKPVALPVQALDHATGYLIAAAVGRALTRRLTQGEPSRVRACLIGTANFLWSLPAPGQQPPMPRPEDFPLEPATTAWGRARRVPVPGQIHGITPRYQVNAGPLGCHDPAWAS